VGTEQGKEMWREREERKRKDSEGDKREGKMHFGIINEINLKILGW
jgi:hypothetical protein